MRSTLLFILAAVMMFAACTSAGDSNPNTRSSAPSPVPSLTAEQPVAPAPTAAAAIPADEGAASDTADFEGTAGNTEKKNPNAAGAVLLKEVRSATHGNYDRMVFEFDGTQLPSYKIEYIDRPVRACGSGDVVPFAGDAWLSVRFTRANAHTEAGEATIRDRTRSPNHAIIKDLKLICDFEAEVEWVAGVASPNKYRVLELNNPTRLVVDIHH